MSRTEAAEPMAQRAQRLIDAFCAMDSWRSVVFRVIGTDIVASRNSMIACPGASLLKTLIADCVAHESIDLNVTVPVSSLHETIYPNILAAFDRDRTLTLGEVLALSIATSDNACADFLIERVGPVAINKRASCLGLTATALTDGFRDSDFATAYANPTSTNDMLRIMEHLYHHRTQDTAHELIWRALGNNIRNNRIPMLLPEGVQVAHKTGSLDGIGHDAAIITHGNTAIALIVMTAKEPHSIARDLAIADLAQSLTTMVLAEIQLNHGIVT